MNASPPRRLNVGEGFVGVGLSGRAVVMDADFRALGGEGAADQTAEVFRAAPYQDGLSFQ